MKINLLNFPFAKGKALLLNVMRIFFFLFFSAAFCFNPVEGLSQNTKIKFESDKTLSVDEIFEEIEKQTSYRFIYPSDLFEKFPQVEVKKGEIELDSLLARSFDRSQFAFQLDESNNIVINRDAIALLNVQQPIVSGTVTDEVGVPIPGVNITVEGTSRGTATDFDGNYSIEADEGEVLKFSSIGFEEQFITIGADSNINVVMKEGTALDEVVVTAFGREMTRNESTSNVATVSSEDITKQHFPDALQALQGKVPGMSIGANTGLPGSSPRIRIRGINSATASNSPLYVIDGVPVNSGDIKEDNFHNSIDIFALISPNDIESISVLKDASGVAPYGAEGSNGVVLITTKSGTAGDTKFNLTISGGVQNDAIKGPRMMSAEEKFNAIEEGMWNSWGSGQFGTGLIESRDDVFDYAHENNANVKAWRDQGYADTDWKEVVKNKNAFIGNINFSMSQGNENSLLYASLGFNKTEGTIIGANFQRWSSTVKYETKITDKIKLWLSTNLSNVNQDGLREGGTLATNTNPNSVIYQGSPWASPYKEDGSFRVDDFNDLMNQANIPFIQKYDIRNNDITRAIPRAKLEFEILENLKFNSVFGIDYTLRYFKNYNNRYLGDGKNQNGKVNENSLRLFQYTTQNSLDYKTTFKDKHGLRFTALQEFSKYKDFRLDGYGENFPNDLLTNISGASANFAATSTFSDRTSLRFVGLANYDFDKRYLVDVSFSYQGDSRFSKKFGSFYSLGLGWNVHKEPFMEAFPKIDVLRLKLGYGVTGNAGIGRNEYQSLLSYGSYNNSPAGIISGFGTDATWEKSTRMDFSMDYGFFENRLNGSLGLFHNKTSDMLFNISIPYTSLYPDGSALGNAGEMENNGIEFNFSGDVFSTPDFNWNISGNVTKIFTSKITSIPEDAETVISNKRVIHNGRKVREWYIVEWAGVDSDDGMPLWYIDRSVDNQTTKNHNEAKPQYKGKSLDPTYFGSLSTRFDYKNIFLEGTLYFSGGNLVEDIRPTTIYSSDASKINTYNGSVRVLEQAWREPGDQAAFPRLEYSNTDISNATQDSDRFLHDGDFIRLRDIAVGYTFDNSTFIEKLGLQRLSLSVRGSNLWTRVKDKTLEWDPEQLTTNGNFVSPVVKSITFNLNVNF